jgi:hypothetical protein
MALLVLSVATRLINLDRYSGSYPEGVRAEQLLLVSAGFRPFKEIFSDQGPWLLQALYPGFLLAGETLFGARITVALASMLGLLAVLWIARQAAGTLAGLTAQGLLVASPTYLQFGRLSVAEELALAPALLALGCGLRFRAAGGVGWMAAAGTLLGVSLLIKPITIGFGLPLLLCARLAERRRRAGLVALGCLTAGTVLLGVLLVGAAEVARDIVQFRAASRGAEGWSLSGNFSRVRAELRPEGLGLLVVGLAGAALAPRFRVGWILLSWLVATLATLMIHAPLHSKHFALLVAPLAALGGFGLGTLYAAAIGGAAGHRTLLVRRLVTGGLVLVWLAGLPALVGRQADLLVSDDLFDSDGARLWYDQAVAAIDSVVGPGEYLVTDHPYLAFVARRLVPPGLAEASAVRVRAGSLTDDLAIEQTERYGVRAVLLWADKLNGLRHYQAWLAEHYTPVQIWAAEDDTRPVLWLRRDARLTEDQGRLAASLGRAEADLGGWRLSAAAVDWTTGARPGPSSQADCSRSISALLELRPDPAASQDARVRLRLVSEPGGLELDTEEEPLARGLGRPPRLIWVGALAPPRGAAASSQQIVRASLVDPRGRTLGPEVDVGRREAPHCAG